jgi:predicted ribosome quality control (RQC) complex YloA/Tae2 family protein
MKFREFVTSSGVIVLGGKSAENNEGLIKQVESDEIVLHTKAPGSPFVNIKGKAKAKDIKEAAVFCARYSQDFRDNKNDVSVHKFYGRDIYKKKGMKTGTFGVRKFKIIKVKKKDIERFLSKF